MTRAIPTLVFVALLAARAAADPPPAKPVNAWKQQSYQCQRPARGCYIRRCCELSLAIFSRDIPDSNVREVRAIGEMDATPARIFAVLGDYAHYPDFMPYTVGSELIEQHGNEVVVWGMVNPPMIARRDWVTRSRLEANLEGGIYRTTWWPELKLGPPPKDGVVRLSINSGSWTLVPLNGGSRTQATYELATDPGGSLPSFIVKAVNTNGLPELFEAIRNRAMVKGPALPETPSLGTHP